MFAAELRREAVVYACKAFAKALQGGEPPIEIELEPATGRTS